MITEAKVIEALEGAALKSLSPWWMQWSKRARRLRRYIKTQSIHRMVLISTAHNWLKDIEKNEAAHVAQARAFAAARKRKAVS